MKRWCYLPFEALLPEENMALDESLFRSFMEKSLPVFRLYGWKIPGITLGKNQDGKKDIDLEACKKDGVPVVSRATGGGAIFHDRELTYSVVCSEDHLDEKDISVKGSFEKIAAFLLEFYRRLGFEPRFAKDILWDQKLGERVPFCFSSSEEYDILIDGKKIGGNAQARNRRILLQHGSIPLYFDRVKASRYFRNGIPGDFTTLSEAAGIEYNVNDVIIIAEKAFRTAMQAELVL